MGDSSRDFWGEVSHCRTNKQTSASYVEVHGDTNIANLWASMFKDLLISKAHSQLADTSKLLV